MKKHIDILVIKPDVETLNHLSVFIISIIHYNLNSKYILFLSGNGEQAAGRWKEHHRSHQRAAEDAGDETAGDR